MIVVCTTPNSPFIEACLDSITQYAPEERVSVQQGPHYETGAWWQAFDQFPHEDHYVCLHDSTVLQQPLGWVKPLTFVSSMRTFEGCSAEHVYRIHDLVAPFVGGCPDPFLCPVGSMFMVEGWVLRRLKEQGWDTVLPTDKFGSQCMERVWGVMFHVLGVTPVSLGSGEECYREDAPIRKFAGRRA